MPRMELAAKAQDSVDVDGKYIFIKSATGSVRVTIEGEHAGKTVTDNIDMEPGDQYEFGGLMRRVTIKNRTNASNDVRFRTGYGRFYPRADGSVVQVEPGATPLDVSVQGTVPVSGPLTDAQLRAAAVPVSGPATDAQLRATDLGTAVHADASGGADRQRVIAAASTNATSIKAAAGRVFAINGTNVSAGTLFLKMYNMAAAPNVGVDTPVETYPLPVGPFSFEFGPAGAQYSTGIALAITGQIGDADATATAANDVVANIHFK